MEKEKIGQSFQRPQLLQQRDSQGANWRAIETRSAGFEALPPGHKPETGEQGRRGTHPEQTWRSLRPWASIFNYVRF